MLQGPRLPSAGEHSEIGGCEREQLGRCGKVFGTGAAMQPTEYAVRRHESCARELENIAVFLECALQADSAAGRFGAGAAAAEARGGTENFPPGGALEAHRQIALPRGIRNTHLRDAMPPAETRSFFRSSLDHAGHLQGALFEIRQGLAQLHEGVRVEGSTEMTEPEDHGRAGRPKSGEAARFAGVQAVDELRGRVADLEEPRHGGRCP